MFPSQLSGLLGKFGQGLMPVTPCDLREVCARGVAGTGLVPRGWGRLLSPPPGSAQVWLSSCQARLVSWVLGRYGGLPSRLSRQKDGGGTLGMCVHTHIFTCPLSALSSKRQEPEVSAGSGVESAVRASDGWTGPKPSSPPTASPALPHPTCPCTCEMDTQQA